MDHITGETSNKKVNYVIGEKLIIAIEKNKAGKRDGSAGSGGGVGNCKL